MKELTAELLTQAISTNESALRLRLKLEPVGGSGDKAFPPTYEGSSYAVEQRLADGKAVQAVLLIGRCAAADPFEKEKPEWPPSPARLFAALASAAFEMQDKEAMGVLRWLEVQKPPIVHAGAVTPRLMSTAKLRSTLSP